WSDRSTRARRYPRRTACELRTRAPLRWPRRSRPCRRPSRSKRRRPPSRSLCSSCSLKLCRLLGHQSRLRDVRELHSPCGPVHVHQDRAALDGVEPPLQALAPFTRLRELDPHIATDETLEMSRSTQLPVQPRRRDLEVVCAG